MNVGVGVDVGGEPDATVAEVIASAVGAPDAAPEAIAEHLADRRGILVIDGAEGASAEVASVAVAVLARARGIAVLSTSRRTLGVPGESVLRVDPLPAEDAQSCSRRGSLRERAGRMPSLCCRSSTCWVGCRWRSNWLPRERR